MRNSSNAISWGVVAAELVHRLAKSKQDYVLGAYLTNAVRSRGSIYHSSFSDARAFIKYCVSKGWLEDVSA